MTDYVELPDQLSDDGDEIYVTLLVPEDSLLPTIRGQWQRLDDGRIEAQYTRPQLIDAVQAGLAIRLGQLQERLDHGEQLIAAAQASGDQPQAEQLAEHYAGLLQQIARLLDAQAICRASLNQPEKR